MFILQISEPADVNRRVYLHLVDSTDGVTAKTGQTGKAWISKNGGTPAQTGNNITEVDATNAPGLYYVQLTVGEVSTPGWIQVRYKAAATLEFQDIGQIVGYDPFGKTIGMGQSPIFDSGPDIDYKKIGRIMGEEISKFKFPKVPAAEKVNFSDVLNAIADVKAAVADIRMPKPEKLDLSSVVNEISSLRKAIGSISIPETDISGLETSLATLNSRLDEVQVENVKSEIARLFERIKDFFDGDIEAFKAGVAEINDKLNKMPYIVLTKPGGNNASEETQP